MRNRRQNFFPSYIESIGYAVDYQGIMLIETGIIGGIASFHAYIHTISWHPIAHPDYQIPHFLWQYPIKMSQSTESQIPDEYIPIRRMHHAILCIQPIQKVLIGRLDAYILAASLWIPFLHVSWQAIHTEATGQSRSGGGESPLLLE